MDTSNLYARHRSHFFVEYSNGEEYDSYDYCGGDGKVCYGHIMYRAEYDYEDEPRNSILGVRKLVVYFNPEWLINRELTEFVLSNEMFGKAFLDTDIDKGLRGGFELDINLPYNYLLGAMITLRYTFSTPYFVERWENFLELCEDKLQALFYADRFSSSVYADITMMVRRVLAYDHSVFPPNFSVRDLGYPSFPEDSVPSSEELNLEDVRFWEVWGEGTRKSPSVSSQPKRFALTKKGFKEALEDERNY